MITLTTQDAQRDWLARLFRQSLELRIIANATGDDTMRAELSDYASRIETQAYELEGRVFAI